jgi:hypothetical protein
MDATIDVSFAPQHEMYPYAEICYIYTVNGDEHYGRYKRGFWYDESARSFAENFVPNNHFSIRVRPDRPEKSYVFEEDQSWWTGFPL